MSFIKESRRKILVFLLSAAIIFSVTACANSPITDDPELKYTPVTVMRVTKGTIENITQFTGIAKPSRLAYAVAPIPGKVSSSYFEVGDRVSKGDLLFTIESSEIEDSIQVMEEQLKVAEATLSMAETGAVAAMGSAYESQKLQLETALKSAESNFISAKDAFDSDTLLMEAGLISKLKYNQARNLYVQAKNALESAIKAHDLYETKVSKDAIAAANDQLKQAQASYDTLKLQIDAARKKLGYTQVTSPIDGIITSKDIVTGCLISNTSVPYTIMDADIIQVSISVTEQVVNKVKKGEKLGVILPSVKSEPFSGTVATVSPAVDPKTLTYNIFIDIPNSKSIIKPGMTAKVGIQTEKHENSIIVPLSSVLTDESGSFVYTVENNQAVKKLVDKGITNEDQIEIISGLEAGELLVVKGQQFLSQNDPVKISGEVTE